MTKIIITALTDQGNAGLKVHLAEVNSMKRRERGMAKMLGIEHTKTNEEPPEVTIEIKNKMLSKVVQPKHLLEQVKDAMTENGAEFGLDYDVRVE